jgi:hypothetical protein
MLVKKPLVFLMPVKDWGVNTAEMIGTSVSNCTRINALITASDKFMAIDAAIY